MEIYVLMTTESREAAYKAVIKFFGNSNSKCRAIEDIEDAIIYEKNIL